VDSPGDQAAGIADGPVDDSEGAMTLSEQVDSLQARVAELKTSLDASRKETSEQIKARIAAAKAKADATRAAVADKAADTADPRGQPVAVVQGRRVHQDGRDEDTHRPPT
jgi:CHASE3 domain sensor protein